MKTRWEDVRFTGHTLFVLRNGEVVRPIDDRLPPCDPGSEGRALVPVRSTRGGAHRELHSTIQARDIDRIEFATTADVLVLAKCEDSVIDLTTEILLSLLGRDYRVHDHDEDNEIEVIA
jgi:hypothetical protein